MLVLGGCVRVAAPQPTSLVCALCDRDLTTDRKRVSSVVERELHYFCSLDHRDQYLAGKQEPYETPYCVVCLRLLDLADAQVRPVTYRDREYFTCSAACAEQFTRDPGLFLSEEPP